MLTHTHTHKLLMGLYTHINGHDIRTCSCSCIIYTTMVVIHKAMIEEDDVLVILCFILCIYLYTYLFI